MNISYNWLNQYLNVESLGIEKLAEILTNTGLEVEGYEAIETIKGGLSGVVVGEVITCVQHPNADRLRCTTVNIGSAEVLNIVCGAPNVAVGQKVAVATVGSTLHFADGNSLTIKKSKIRGELSEGMICAEDELGIGTSHEGIMVLPAETPVGKPVAELFDIKTDYQISIGLTPNRSDAMCHVGVATDVAAYINANLSPNSPVKLCKPNVEQFSLASTGNFPLKIEVLHQEACPLYMGLALENISVNESPSWLKNALLAIGLKPINNVVDVTNYVMHELGQPLHAFDADKITGQTIVVKKAVEGDTFITLDGVSRKLSADDLMICNAQEPMCIAGVFGGLSSGVQSGTKKIVLESAIFDSVSIRKSARKHQLFTDASFRFERGVSPEVTRYALLRAASLICELTGAKLSSEPVVVDSLNFKRQKITISKKSFEALAGISIPVETLTTILESLEFTVEPLADADTFNVSVPGTRRDVERPIDVYEEILRIYGFNKVDEPEKMHISVNTRQKPDEEKLIRISANFLIGLGFNEIMNNSLTAKSNALQVDDVVYGEPVEILNPLSSDLGIMRQSLAFGALESCRYNTNRQQPNLKFFEFGSVYFKSEASYKEEQRILLMQTGNTEAESWHTKSVEADFYHAKNTLLSLLARLGIEGLKEQEYENQLVQNGVKLLRKKTPIAYLGLVKPAIAKKYDLTKPVLLAEIHWDSLLTILKYAEVKYTEVSKFPSVRRDLALLVDSTVTFETIKEAASKAERKLLRAINLFDVYEGKNLPEGKKSYAVSFVLHNSAATLTDKEIDNALLRIKETIEKDCGATLRQ
ncbi:MAG: phenylalanine--tRNA ligase subunit beta [Luteibaculaceae bacterium]